MSCYQLIITIAVSHRSKSFIFICYSHFDIIIKNSKQSLETTSTILQSQSLDLVTIVIVINVVIVGFSGEDL